MKMTKFDTIMNNYLSERKRWIAELDASGLKEKNPDQYDLIIKLIDNNRPILCDLTTGITVT